MKRRYLWICTATLMLTSTSLWASIGASKPLPPETAPQTVVTSDLGMDPDRTLDEVCTVDFTTFTWGSIVGALGWPGGNGVYMATGTKFLNSCPPQDTLYAYCVDIDHDMRADAYCADISPATVAAASPEQLPAMAYLLTWYPASDAASDRLAQLSLWKLSTDWRTGSATYGLPYYYANAGRGWPAFEDTPVFPYVNTVFNSVPTENDPACELVRYLLGSDDGQAKNVVFCDDQFVLSSRFVGEVEGTAEIEVTIRLVRGASAIAIGNTAVGGVKLQLSVDVGELSATEVWTDGVGTARMTITQPAGTTTDSHLRVCSRGFWPKLMTPCTAGHSQVMITQPRSEADYCNLCAGLTIPADQFLPVELVSFAASPVADDIVLAWRTASENQTSGWEIERRIAGTGHFALLAQLPAANSPTGHAYRWTDRSAQRGARYDYRLADVALNGIRTVHPLIRSAGLTGGSAAVGEYSLSANYPNPFNPETRIRFTLAEAGPATLTVYDIIGNVVAVLAQGKLAAGEHTVTFQAAALPSGVYFYTLRAGSFSQTRKMVLMK